MAGLSRQSFLKQRQSRQKGRKKRVAGRGAFFWVWLRRFGMICAICVAVLWGAAWLWLSGAAERGVNAVSDYATAQTVAAGFAVQDILVEGREHSDAASLLSVLGVQDGDPILTFDPHQAQSNVAAMVWVKDVTIERRLPSQIYVHIEEKKPIALYKPVGEGSLVVLDEAGEAITDHNISRFRDLILVSGQGAAKAAPEFVKLFENQLVLKPLVESALRVSNRRWDVKFKSGVVVKLPEHDARDALIRLSQAQGHDGILNARLTGIDLREEGRMILKTKPGQDKDYNGDYKVNFLKHGI